MPEAITKPLRIALFTGNYDYIKDGVSLTLNRLVAYLEKNNIPVLIGKLKVTVDFRCDSIAGISDSWFFWNGKISAIERVDVGRLD